MGKNANMSLPQKILPYSFALQKWNTNGRRKRFMHRHNPQILKSKRNLNKCFVFKETLAQDQTERWLPTFVLVVQG